MTDTIVKMLAMDLTKTRDKISIREVQHSELDRESGLLTSYDQFTVQKGSENHVYEGKFSLQLYSANQLREILKEAGFKGVKGIREILKGEKK